MSKTEKYLVGMVVSFAIGVSMATFDSHILCTDNFHIVLYSVLLFFTALSFGASVLCFIGAVAENW